MAAKAHPKCVGCARALYKSLEAGAVVATSDPFAYCRNPKCARYGKTPEQAKEDGRAAKSKAINARRRARPAAPADPLAAARVQVREVLAQVAEGESPQAVGLVLALLSLETGNHRAANALIEEHQLGKFGLEPVEELARYPRAEKKSAQKQV